MNKNKYIKWLQSKVQRYNHDKYWRRRTIVTNPQNKTNLFIKLYYLFYIKRCDSWNLCSFGTDLNNGAFFKSPPNLWHGPNGIIIGHDVSIGQNVTICQRVTIAHGGGCTIGDNVLIGAGATILGHVRIGNNVKIGANCVVTEDLPDNSTCVCQKARIILHQE